MSATMIQSMSLRYSIPLATWLIATTTAIFGQSPCQTSATTINDPATNAWADKLISALGEDDACHVERADDDQAAFTANTPCNIFAGRVIDRVYGLRDFYVSPPQEGKPFYRANEIGTLLKAGVWSGWTDLGSADSQGVLNQAKSAADNGDLVVAVWINPNPDSPGHIALIGPGPMRHSNSWDEDTPASASLTLGNPNAGFLGKPLSCAFSSDKAGGVEIWSHSKQ